MDKNYYDELEISKEASDEIINKAYKILAKKYHPDTYSGTNKDFAEEKFKKISNAYKILSNDQKRKEYDLQLSAQEVSKEDFDSLLAENEKLRKDIINLKNAINRYSNQDNINHSHSSTYTKKNITAFQYIKYYIFYYLKKLFILSCSIVIVLSVIFALLKIPVTRQYILQDLHFESIFKIFNINF